MELVVWAPKLNTLLVAGGEVVETAVAATVVDAVVEDPNAWATEVALKGKARPGAAAVARVGAAAVAGVGAAAATVSVFAGRGVKAEDPDPNVNPPLDTASDGVSLLLLLKNPLSPPPPTELTAVLTTGC